MIGHLLRRWHSELRESAKRGGHIGRLLTGEQARSPKWRAVEKEHLKAQPMCMVCGGVKHLQVHHLRPFHDFPELELDPKNLITGCMGKFECHLRVLHGGSFQFYNPEAASDAALLMKYPFRRPMVEANAKVKRLPN
jgi:hypothetical protein